nr:MAG TPA: hypothetical protein [Caudoviricetes sp.]
MAPGSPWTCTSFIRSARSGLVWVASGMALGSPAYAYIARGGTVWRCNALCWPLGGYGWLCPGSRVASFAGAMGGLWVSLWARLGHSGSLRDTLMDTTGILLGYYWIAIQHCMTTVWIISFANTNDVTRYKRNDRGTTYPATGRKRTE